MNAVKFVEEIIVNKHFGPHDHGKSYTLTPAQIYWNTCGDDECFKNCTMKYKYK